MLSAMCVLARLVRRDLTTEIFMLFFNRLIRRDLKPHTVLNLVFNMLVRRDITHGPVGHYTRNVMIKLVGTAGH